MEATAVAVTDPDVSDQIEVEVDVEPDREARCDALRWRILTQHQRAGAGHLGSSLSLVELLVVVLGERFRWRSAPGAADGDRFVLSKGHAALGFYCALAELGRLPAELLNRFGHNGVPLEPHPNERRLDVVDASTGSLGQGLSIGAGLALGARLRGRPATVYVVLGDGECNEGQIWEAARSAASLRLDNLVVLLDDNRMQQDGPTRDILDIADLPDAWARMGWHVASCDGHDCQSIVDSLDELDRQAGAPKLLRARTIKAHGVPFLEQRAESHYPPPLTGEELAMLRYLDRQGTP